MRVKRITESTSRTVAVSNAKVARLTVTPPGLLDAVGQQMFDAISPKAIELGLLVPGNVPIWESYCDTYSRYRTAVLDLRQAAMADEQSHGVVMDVGRSGVSLNPLHTATNVLARLLRDLAGTLCLTPVAMRRMGLVDVDNKSDAESVAEAYFE